MMGVKLAATHCVRKVFVTAGYGDGVTGYLGALGGNGYGESKDIQKNEGVLNTVKTILVI